MSFPQKITAGDEVQWRLKSTQDNFGNPISSPDWSVVYSLRTNKQNFGATVNSSAYEDGFQFTISSSITSAFNDGDWFYQAKANKSGNNITTIASGTFKVLPKLDFTGSNPSAFDGRTQAKKDLDAIEQAIRNIYSGGGLAQQYKIGNRDIKKYDLPDLLVLRDRLKAQVVREDKETLIANGLGNPHNKYIRIRG